MSFPAVTVMVPTFNRPEGLTKAVDSLFAQTFLKTGGFALVIVDNHPGGTAKAAIEALRQRCPEGIAFEAIHQPAAGVANARNAGLDRVRTNLVAFLDDDMTAPADWLEQLLSNYAAFPAPVTFGPVLTALPDDLQRHRAYFSAFFARDPKHTSGYIEAQYGCGNALMDFSKIPGDRPYFDVTMNEIGGEDDRLFERVRGAGGRFAWAGEAKVYEHPLRQRLKLNYTLRRAFAYGQAPITMARLADRVRRLSIAKWMVIGAGKTAIHGTAWLGLRLIFHPKRAFQIDKAVRGLGKVLWFLDFKFYGNAALKQVPPKVTLYTPRPKSVRAATSDTEADESRSKM